MSDSDFDEFDSFAVDESFLQQVDDITARAAAAPTTATSANTRPDARVGASARPISRADPNAGPSRRAAALGVRRARPPAPPSSDDFDDMSFSAESLAQIDSAAAQTARASSRSAVNGTTHLPSSGIERQVPRTNSGQLMLQTHLNFRRDNPQTKGKRWDRTAFAASGRRRVVAKGKAKGKGRAVRHSDDDSDDDLDAPLAPDPAPLVDTTKPYEPQRHHYDDAAIKTYLYPTNHPKREYQYDIIRSCLADNCLVALPTGLGKTFVAGVVMLNFYRWFPTGKIVFLAPTRPLVNQQIEACQLTCGIPSKDAAVMTGASVSAKDRERMWDARRVFYCTPQTLDNDLKRGAVDPRDIVLAVFDEAHKASGSYAYTTILAYITASNPYFRVLALTATPGSDVDKVQGVVDALHISRIEIREAEAPEISKYMNEKRMEKHVVPMSPVFAELRDRWAALMKPTIQKLVQAHILQEWALDPKRLRTFSLTMKRMEIMKSRDGARWALGALTQVEKMARAMASLLEFSLGMFHSTVMEMAGNPTEKGKKGNTKGGMELRKNAEFQRLVMDVENEMNDINRHRNGKSLSDKHPKMNKTLELLLSHFAQADEDEKVHGIKNDTRAMVFCSLRECVLDVVDMLNEHPDLLRATKFVGQSQGKQEKDKGFTQKEQKQTINEFKEGKYNILVSTSIGEEGLDIGEVDFVVIYDMPKQSIKLLQRIGRTGRKRDGQVHVLMSEGREDLNLDTAQRTHRDIQEEILHSRNLELFEDVERLVPPGPLPKCVEQHMEVDPWDPEDQRKKLPAASQDVKGGAAKKKRVAQVPEGHGGFQSVAQMLKDAQKRQKRKREGSSSEDEEKVELSDDGDADELLYGKVGSVRTGLKPKKGVVRSSGAKRAKSSEANSSGRSREEARASAEEERRREAEELDRRARDFFSQTVPKKATQSLDESPERATPPSSPHAYGPGASSGTADGAVKLSPNTAKLAGFSQIDLALSDDEDLKPSPPPTRASHMTDMPPPPVPSSPLRSNGAVQTPLSRAVAHSPQFSGGTEPTPFPVRRRRTVAMGPPSSDPADSPAVRPLQRLRRRHVSDSSPSAPVALSPSVAARAPRRRRREPNGDVAGLLDVDAGVSGSESSDESSGAESESDRLFAGDFAPTQAPKGYNQRAMYAAGLSTQVAGRAGLAFKSRDNAPAFLAKARRPVMVSDDERSSDNEYELGSFVCDDEEDVSFDTQSEHVGSGL